MVLIFFDRAANSTIIHITNKRSTNIGFANIEKNKGRNFRGLLEFICIFQSPCFFWALRKYVLRTLPRQIGDVPGARATKTINKIKWLVVK